MRVRRTNDRPHRRTAALHAGRLSVPGARYFVTPVVRHREPRLLEPATAQHLATTMCDLDAQGDWSLHAATIMPDHAHMLFTLGTRLRLGKVLAKFKALARRAGVSGWEWQDDYFEHRLREREESEAYGRYIFLNPYRAGLSPLECAWPWWVCPDERRFRFLDHLGPRGGPPCEWLEQLDRPGDPLPVGE